MISIDLYHKHLCQICKKSLKTPEGIYKYYHPNCIIQERKGKKLADFIYRDEYSTLVTTDDNEFIKKQRYEQAKNNIINEIDTIYEQLEDSE